MSLLDHDDELRANIFAYIDLLTRVKDVVSQQQLMAFEFQGNVSHFSSTCEASVSFRGLPAALTIRTTFRKNPEDLPYADEEGADGYYRYKWQGTDPGGPRQPSAPRSDG